uniref:Putative cbf1-interacting corepressor cir n=1 Tax=Amblyomma aureolatum TaxID=187763 RepID=A0A1E1X667_9ACAR
MSSTKSDRRGSQETKPRSTLSDKERNLDTEKIQALKHIDTFYSQPPPGLIQEERENPEDCIPDLPENRNAREFLSKAPTKGLWMPLGKEVKVMKCWRCKAYGHRTGDRECPMFFSGNSASEEFRFVHEDPMHDYVKESKATEKQERIRQLQALLEESSDSDSSSSSSSSSSSTPEEESRKRRHKHSHSKQEPKKKHRRKSRKKHKKK